MFRPILHLLIILMLTVITQIGGFAWAIALLFKYRKTVFVGAYGALWVLAFFTAPHLGREPLPCFENQGLVMQSKMYCVLNRHYVAPELKDVLIDLSDQMQGRFPGTTTLILDANFPFLTGFPLLPHLSHDDGQKVDLAFYYRDQSGYQPNFTRSPVGYFAFEQGPTDCPDTAFTLRWNLTWLQGFWRDSTPDHPRMSAALRTLSNDPRVGKIFIEPHLRRTFGVSANKIRFQGCRAARHDDHIHIQL